MALSGAQLRFVFTMRDQATAQMRRLGSTANQAAQSVGNTTRNLAQFNQQAAVARQRMAGMGLAGQRLHQVLLSIVSVTAGMWAIRQMADFGDNMAIVEGVTGATAITFQTLSYEAQLMGIRTRFTASQAAEAMVELARGGMKAGQIIGSLQGTLDLAASGGLDLAEAAALTIVALSSFNLHATEATRVADLMSFAANNSATNVHEIGEGMKYVGSAAAAFGVSIEEVMAATAGLADRGIRASMAGTGLRRVITRLNSDMKVWRETVARLGLTMDDVSTRTNGLVRVLHTLKDAGLDRDPSTIMSVFGDRGGPLMINLLDNLTRIDELFAAMGQRRTPVEQVGKAMELLAANGREASEEIRNSFLELFDPNSETTRAAMMAGNAMIHEMLPVESLQARIETFRNIGHDRLVEMLGPETAEAIGYFIDNMDTFGAALATGASDADGFARRVSFIMDNNLGGAIRRFQAAFEGLFISLGQTQDGYIRDSIENIAFIARAFVSTNNQLQTDALKADLLVREATRSGMENQDITDFFGRVQQSTSAGALGGEVPENAPDLDPADAELLKRLQSSADQAYQRIQLLTDAIRTLGAVMIGMLLRSILLTTAALWGQVRAYMAATAMAMANARANAATALMFPRVAQGIRAAAISTQAGSAAAAAQTGVFARLGRAFSGVGVAFMSLLRFLGLTTPWGRVIALVVTLATALVALQHKTVSFGGTTVTVGDIIGGAWDTISDGFGEAMASMQQWLADRMPKFLVDFGQFLQRQLDNMGQALQGFVDDMAGDASEDADNPNTFGARVRARAAARVAREAELAAERQRLLNELARVNGGVDPEDEDEEESPDGEETADQRARRLRDQFNQQITTLTQQREALSQTREQQMYYNAVIAAGIDLNAQDALSIERRNALLVATQALLSAQIDQQVRNINVETEAIAERARIAQLPLEQQALANRLLEAQLQLARDNNAETLYQYQLREGLIDAINRQAAAEARVAAQSRSALGGIQAGWRRWQEQVQNVGEQLQNTVGNALNGLADAFTQWFMGQKVDWADFARTIIAEIMKIIVQMLVMKAVKMTIGLFESGGVFGGMFGDAKGSAVGHRFDGAQRFAKGSAFANQIVASPTLFKFARGAELGVMGEAGPEAVMPLRRMRNGNLGVQVQGGGGTVLFSPSIVLNVQSQGDAELDDALAKKMGMMLDALLTKKFQEFQQQQARNASRLRAFGPVGATL